MKLSMNRRWALLLTAVILFPAIVVSAKEAKDLPRAALLDFTSDDGYYHSTLAAADFAAGVQASLFTDSPVQWVERSQLQTAMNELDLTALSLNHGASLLRVGKWVKADLLIIGRFVRPAHGNRELIMEVVDSNRAEMLVREKVAIQGDPRDPVPVRPSEIEAAIRCVRGLLRTACASQDGYGKRVVVAPLFFRNLSDSPRLDYLEGDLLGKLHGAAGQSDRTHVLNFLRPEPSAAESELAVLGLVEADKEAWLHVADVYVWGSYREEKSQGLSFDQVPVSVSITLFGGSGSMREITRRFRVSQISEALNALAGDILAQAAALPGGRANTGARETAAKALRERAEELEKTLSRYGGNNSELFKTPFGRAMRRNLLETLEVSHFLDPLQRNVYEKMISVRWSGQDTDASANLLAKWPQAADYEQYKRLFGIQRDDHTMNAWLIDNYTAVLRGILNDLRKQSRPEWASLDVPENVLQEWEAHISRRFIQLIRETVSAAGRTQTDYNEILDVQGCMWTGLGCIHDPKLVVEFIEAIWPAYQPYYVQFRKSTRPGQGPSIEEGIQRVYAQTGHPERARELFAFGITPTPAPATRPASFGFTSRPHYAVNAPPIRSFFGPGFPRTTVGVSESPLLATIADVRPAMRSVLFTAPSRVLANLKLGHPMPPSSTRGARPGFQIERMVIGQDRLWISGQFSPEGNRPPGPPALYCYDPAGDVLVNVSEKIGQHSRINDLLYRDGKLWLALAFDGVWSVDLQTLDVQRFGGRQGLLTPRVLGAAALDNRLYFAGAAGQGTLRFNSFDAPSGKWGELSLQGPIPVMKASPANSSFAAAESLYAFRHWLLLAGSRRSLLDARTGTVETLGAELDPPPAAPQENHRPLWFGPRPGLPTPVREGLRAVTADDSGFWLGTARALIHLNPETKQLERVSAEGLTLLSLADGRDVLWVAASTPVDQHLRQMEPVPFPGHPFVAAREARYYLLGWKKAEHTWLGKVELPSRVTAMTAYVNGVWLAVDRPNEPLVRIDRTVFSPVAWIDRGGKALKNKDGINRPDQFGVMMLMKAAATGSVDMVDALIKAGADVNGETPEGWTALMTASRDGCTDIVRLLTTKGADANAAQLYSFPSSRPYGPGPMKLAFPLLLAAEAGHTEVVKCLVDNGADVAAQNGFGQTPLIAAAGNGRTQTVQFLLSQKGDPNLFRDVKGNTALHVAAWGGYADIVEILVRQGAAIDAINNASLTPLHIAVDQRRDSAAKILLAAGANPGRTDQTDITVIEKILRQNNLPLLKEMLRYQMEKRLSPQAMVDAFNTAVAQCPREYVDLLLPKVSMLNVAGKRGICPLEAAAGRGDLGLVKTLLARGAEVSARVDNTTAGGRAIFAAVRGRSADVIQLLLDRGVSVQERDSMGRTPLMWAVIYNQPDLVSLLLKAHADVNAVDQSGKGAIQYAQTHPAILAVLAGTSTSMPSVTSRSPLPAVIPAQNENHWLLNRELMEACAKGSLSGVRDALGRGADPNAKRDEKWPTLVLAAAKGQVEIVKALLEAKADARARGVGKWTAMMEAAGNNHAEVVKLLIDHGALLQDENDWGKTALDIAERRGCRDAVRALEQANARKTDGRAMIQAVDVQDRRAMGILVAAGTDIDGTGDGGRSALFHAVDRDIYVHEGANLLDIVAWLLEHGANPNLADANGRTPFMGAIMSDRDPAFIRLMLKHGAKVDVADKEGQTPLMYARQMRQESWRDEVVQLLKEAGAQR